MMINKKEIIGVVVATIMMVVMLIVGLCIGGKKDTISPIEQVKKIRVWGSVPASAGPAQVIKNFNLKYEKQGVKAEYCYYDNTVSGNKGIETTILSGSNVDVYFTYDIAELESRVKNNMAVDLSAYLQRDHIELHSYYNIDVTPYYIQNKPYAIPTKVDQYGITINKDMFDEAGVEVPTEWDYEEFRQIAKKLTKGEGRDKVYGMFFCTQQNFAYLIDFIAPCSMGGNPLYNMDTGLSNFDSIKMKKLVTLVYQMMNVDGSAPTHVDSVTQKLTQESMFLEGKCAMTIGPWIIRSVKDYENYPHEFTTAFVPYPVVDKSEDNYDQGRLGDFLSISPNSKYKEECWKFVKWYTTEGILPMVEGGRIPAYKGFDVNQIKELLLTNDQSRIDPVSAVRVLIMPKEKYAVATQTNKLSDLVGIFRDEMESIMLEEKTVEEGMNTAKQRADVILQE